MNVGYAKKYKVIEIETDPLTFWNPLVKLMGDIHMRGIAFEISLLTLGFGADASWRTNHGGIRFECFFLKWIFRLSYYDSRHWDPKKKAYKTYENEKLNSKWTKILEIK
jgi:hypothetical protein